MKACVSTEVILLLLIPALNTSVPLLSPSSVLDRIYIKKNYDPFSRFSNDNCLLQHLSHVAN